MSTVPAKYQPSQRLIDDPDELRRLYCKEGLSIREIADEHAEVGSTAVGEALQEYQITDGFDAAVDSKRGTDPPTTTDTSTTVRPDQPDWSNV